MKLARQPAIPANDGREDELLDVSLVGISGRYIELEKQGKLEELLELQETRKRLSVDLMVVESELSEFGNPLCLLNFYAKVRNRAGKFDTQLKARAARLEKQRAKLRGDLTKIEGQISRIEPLLLTVPFADAPNVERPPAIRIGEDSFVLVRDYEIKLAAAEGLSDLDICKRLDFKLVQPTGVPLGMPERWKEEFGEIWKRSYGGVSYVAAYQCPETKNNVQKMISVAKSRLRMGSRLTSPAP